MNSNIIKIFIRAQFNEAVGNYVREPSADRWHELAHSAP